MGIVILMETMEAGRVLADRYRIERPMGRGGMATVYAGTDSRLGRPVAVKCLHPSLAIEGAGRRFEVEAQLAARLNHPNIVAVHDAGDDDGCAFMVMELLPGRTLGDEMASGPMPSGRCADVARQVLSALSAAHQAGVVHRDIKPSNLLLGPDGTVKVADFGIATSLEVGADLTRTGELIGTASYIAPERLEGASATAASDLYSLGAVLYEALAGHRLFSADNPLAYARQVLETRPAPISTVAPGTDPALAAVIDRVLAKDPAARFTTAAEMMAALDGPTSAIDETIGWGLPPVAPDALPAPTDVLVRRQPPRPSLDRRWWAAAAVALAVVVLFIIASASGGHSSGSPSTPTSPPSSAVSVAPNVPAPLAQDLARLQAAASSK